jgi:type IV pilus assembly protein PilB
MSAKLGEILVRENLITPQQLREALDHQRVAGGMLGSSLVKLWIISDDVITAVLSRQYGVPSINLDLFNIEEEVIKLIPQEVALKYTVLPISKVGATLTLAMVDPTNVFAMDDIKFMTGLNIEPVVVSEASVQEAISRYYAVSREIELARNGEDEEGQYSSQVEALPQQRNDLTIDLADFNPTPREQFLRVVAGVVFSHDRTSSGVDSARDRVRPTA